MGGGVALAVLVIACIIAVKFGKGIISWVAVGILSLIMLNHIMVRFEIPLGRAISDFIILMGLSALTVQNIIAILTGKYWNIKTNSIFGRGRDMSCARLYRVCGCVVNLGGLCPPFLF